MHARKGCLPASGFTYSESIRRRHSARVVRACLSTSPMLQGNEALNPLSAFTNLHTSVWAGTCNNTWLESAEGVRLSQLSGPRYPDSHLIRYDTHKLICTRIPYPRSQKNLGAPDTTSTMQTSAQDRSQQSVSLRNKIYISMHPNT